MARIEAQNQAGLYSSGSKYEPFANFLNNVGTGTVAAAGLVAALNTDFNKLPSEPQSSQELVTRLTSADMLANLAVYAGPVAAVLLINKALYSIYQRLPEEKQRQVQARVAELGSYFRKS
jgi:hypothetical protein